MSTAASKGTATARGIFSKPAYHAPATAASGRVTASVLRALANGAGMGFIFRILQWK